MKKLLFLCTHNSCRSQMAEALVNHELGDRFEAFSAGTEATRVNPIADLVLTDVGIDISHHYSKTIDAFAGQTFDHVITLCGDANEKCPLFSAERNGRTSVSTIHRDVQGRPAKKWPNSAVCGTRFAKK